MSVVNVEAIWKPKESEESSSVGFDLYYATVLHLTDC